VKTWFRAFAFKCNLYRYGWGLCRTHGGVRLCADDECNKRAKASTYKPFCLSSETVLPIKPFYLSNGSTCVPLRQGARDVQRARRGSQALRRRGAPVQVLNPKP
jgi:hypothetical protein